MFSGTLCLLRHHTQWIRPLHWGLNYKSIPILIRLHFFLDFYFTLNQYGGWIRPVQYRLHYSTVECIVKLYHAFQN